MEHHPDIDDVTAERLLSGRLGADDAPRRLRGVAALLAAAGHADDAPADPAVVAAMVAALTATPGTLDGGARRRPAVARLLTAKAAAVVGVLALSASGAAATGQLPAAAQERLARLVSHVGIQLPTSDDDESADEDADEAGADQAGTTDAHGTSADTHGATVAETARTTEATGREKGEAVSAVARDNHGQAGEHPTGEERPTGPPDGKAPAEPARPATVAPPTTAPPTTAAPQAPAGSPDAERHPTPDDHPRGRP